MAHWSKIGGNVELGRPYLRSGCDYGRLCASSAIRLDHYIALRDR
jgi:hypothetical protein